MPWVEDPYCAICRCSLTGSAPVGRVEGRYNVRGSTSRYAGGFIDTIVSDRGRNRKVAIQPASLSTVHGLGLRGSCAWCRLVVIQRALTPFPRTDTFFSPCQGLVEG